jgi:hypothetical protein
MKSIDYFSFSLTKDNQQQLDLNGEHWAITVQIDFLYEKPFKPHRRMNDDMEEETKEDEINI